MRPTFADYERSNPFRPLDWRRQRAEELAADTKRVRPQHADAITREAVRYLRQRERCGTDRQSRDLVRRFPGIDQAWRLHERGGWHRTVVEAGVLARQTTDEIADSAGLACETIDTYESLCFNVRDRLTARKWIMLAAIGHPEDSQSDQERRERLIKWLAYFGGPVVLGVALRSFGFLPKSAQDETNDDPELLDHRLNLLEALRSGSVPLRTIIETAEVWRDVTAPSPTTLEAVLDRKTSETVRQLFETGGFRVNIDEVKRPIATARSQISEAA